MSFIDNTVFTAKEIFDVASKKTTEAVEIQKIRFAIHKKHSELNKSFEMLGRAYYQNRKESKDEWLDSLCKDVERITMELQALKERLEIAKKMRVCPDCGQKNPADSVFCNSCGKAF